MSGSVVTRYSSIPMRRRILNGEVPPMIAKHKRRICETCEWCTEMTATHAFCNREETMAHGWNRRESRCEEHGFKVPNVQAEGAAHALSRSPLRAPGSASRDSEKG
jgi:hypothetical protein